MKKYSCSRTKAEAIVCKVLAPFSAESIAPELNQCRFGTLLTDASNHGNIKMFPVMVRYFVPTSGVRVELLEFTAEPGETGEITFNVLKRTWEAHGLEKKVVTLLFLSMLSASL